MGELNMIQKKDQEDLKEVMKSIGLADVTNIVGAEDLSPVITTLLNRTDMQMLPLLRRMEAKYGKGKEVKLLEHTWREKNLIAQADIADAKFDPENEPGNKKSNYIKRRNHVMAIGHKVGVGLVAQKEASGWGVSDLLSTETNDRIIDLMKTKDFYWWNGTLDNVGPAFEMRGLKPGLLNCSASNIQNPAVDPLRDLDQYDLDEVLQAIFDSGAVPTAIYVSHHFLASRIAGFTNNGADKIAPQIIVNSSGKIDAGVETMTYASNASHGVRLPIVVANNLGYRFDALSGNVVRETNTASADTQGFLVILCEDLIKPVHFLPLLQLEAVATGLMKHQYVLEVFGCEDRHTDTSTVTAHGMINNLKVRP